MDLTFQGCTVDQTNDKSLTELRGKQLYERAFFFKRLAIGAADPKFAAKLQTLVKEYESAAARITLEAEPVARQGHGARAQGTPEVRAD